jgi:hypothetical protein
VQEPSSRRLRPTLQEDILRQELHWYANGSGQHPPSHSQLVLSLFHSPAFAGQTQRGMEPWDLASTRYSWNGVISLAHRCSLLTAKSCSVGFRTVKSRWSLNIGITIHDLTSVMIT